MIGFLGNGARLRRSLLGSLMRHLALLLGLAALMEVAACAAVIPANGTTQPAMAVARLPQRGDIIAMDRLEAIDRATLQDIASSFPGSPSATTGAQLYRLTYWTELRGQRAIASGLVSVPLDMPAALGVILYAHGTTMTRALAPSEPDRADGLQETAIFAGNGYLVVLPDYIGLGQSPLPQAYSVVQPQVDASIDMLMALRAWARHDSMVWNPSLMLMGFSQGGQTVAGLHRSLERAPLADYDLLGTVAIAGPHGLRDLLLDKLQEPAALDLSSIGYVAFAVTAYAQYYGHPLDQTLAAPYASTLPALFDGSHSVEQIAEGLPADARSLFRPEVLADLNAGRETWFTRALEENDTDAWVPEAPLWIVYGDADTNVPPVSSRALYNYAEPRDGAVTLHPMGPVDHMTTAERAYAPALQWFEDLAAARIR